MTTTTDLDELRRVAKWERCTQCSGSLVVVWQGAAPPAWGQGSHILRCTKNAGHKGIKPYFASEREINMVNASSNSLVRYSTPLGEVELSPESIRTYLCPKATVTEAFFFLQKCRFQRLNPWAGEAYLVIYEQTQTSPRTAQMIIGKQAHTRRAERHPDFEGMEAGIIVLHDGGTEQVAGAFMAPNDQLLGGWCKVHRKGKTDTFISVGLKEYDKGTSPWKRMPATMIRKVAITQALSEAFPSEMAGLQGSDEFALAEEQATVIEGQLAQAPAEPAAPPLREGRDLERDIADLYPDNDHFPGTQTEEAPPDNYEPFDPETAPPPPLPDTVHSRGHFEQVLKDEGWTTQRLEADVLHMPFTRYLTSHTIDQAYQSWKGQVANRP